MDSLEVFILALIVAFSGGGIAWLGRTTNAYIAEKTKGHRFSLAISRLNEVIFTIVAAIQQTEVKAIKAAKDPDSPGGTKITKEEAVLLVALALETIKIFIGEKGIKAVMYVLGVDDSKDFDEYLTRKIEATVIANKKK